jgi:predicted phosphodiesterase
MAAPRTKAREWAEELCSKFPDTPNLTLAKRLAKEHPEASNVESARSHIRVIRGATGKRAKPWATQPRAKGVAGQLPPMPPSLAKPWKTFDIKGKTRCGIISDLHLPYHSDMAIETALEWLSKKKIDTLLINGDAADFYAASKWDKNPERVGMKRELEMVDQSLTHIRKRFPRNRIIYKAGNHEERWNKFVWAKAPEIWDLNPLQLPELLQLNKHKIEWVEDQRPIMLGKLPILHGHELPKGIASPVNAARGAWMRTKHTVLVGHSHQTSGHCEPNMFHDECFVWSTGCLCDLNAEYARINRWNHGFAYVETTSSGDFDVTNLRIAEGGIVRGG